MPGPWRTPEDVATDLGVTRRKLMRFCRRHNVPFMDMNGTILFDTVAIAALENACRSVSSPVETPALSGLRVPSIQPARHKGSECDAVRAQIAKRVQEKRRGSSRSRSCATITSGRVLPFATSPKQQPAI